MSTNNQINIDVISPVAGINSSNVTVVVEGTACLPAPPANIPEVAAESTASTPRKAITQVGLSLRAHFTPFNLPSIDEVVATLHLTFLNEPGDSTTTERLRTGPIQNNTD